MPICLSQGRIHQMRGLRPDGHAGKCLDIGTERIRKTGSTGKPMWFIKVSNELCGGKNKHRAPYQWEKKHLLIWERAYGKIPKGNKIVFLNSDTLDCRLDNLFIVSDAVHMEMIRRDWYSTNPILTKAAILCLTLDRLLI